MRSLSVGASALLTGAGLSGSAGATTVNGSKILGDFRQSRDGWRSLGPDREKRIKSEQSSVITTGEHGLQVPFTETRFGRIENKGRIREADFLANRYLFGRVVSSVTRTNSPLVFFARLHYTPSQSGNGQDRGNGRGNGQGQNPGRGNGQGRGNGTGGRGKPVVESRPIVVPQNTTHSLYWDLSAIPDQIRRTVRRLEIVWFLADHPPAESGPNRGHGNSDYRGTVLFDHIRLTDKNDEVTRQALEDKRQDLQHFHGPVVDSEVANQTDDMEIGNLVYSDGETIMYGVNYHNDETTDGQRDATYVLGGERFVFMGDQ